MYYGLNSDFQKRDVAIYARVSTEHEAQLSALGNQLDWYKPILAARPDWTLTAQYMANWSFYRCRETMNRL